MKEIREATFAPFVILVFVLALPFWLAGIVDRSLFSWLLPVDLPTSALSAIVPMVAALTLSCRNGGREAAAKLLRAAVDVERIKGHLAWLVTAVLLMPGLLALQYGVLLLMGRFIPNAEFPVGLLPIYAALFFVGAVGEELGWQAYLIASLRGRCDALQAALTVGLVWASWHLVPFLQTHHSLSWVVWQSLHTILARVLIVWISNNAGQSVFLAVIFQMMINVSEFMFPNYGSHYAPSITSVMEIAVVSFAALFWGPATLAEFRMFKWSTD